MIRSTWLFLVLLISLPLDLSAQENAQEDQGADIREILQVSPEDVLRARRAVEAHEDAQYRQIRDPEVIAASHELFLSPEEQPVKVYLLQRSPTNILFTDATGTHWPIKSYFSYDSELIGASQAETKFNNSLVLHGKLPAGSAFVSVYLEKLNEPITLNVVVGRDKYHSDIHLKVMQVGPETKVTKLNMDMASTIGLEPDVDLNHALYGVDPYGSKKLETSQAGVLVWEKDGEIIVRTRLHIFSPPYKRVKSGNNGYNAYRMNDTSRIYATGAAGKVIEIHVRES